MENYHYERLRKELAELQHMIKNEVSNFITNPPQDPAARLTVSPILGLSDKLTSFLQRLDWIKGSLGFITTWKNYFDGFSVQSNSWEIYNFRKKFFLKSITTFF